ncbi:lipopolysaccharide biosynthesis protein [Methanocella arvoryzae]|uniref:Oligosaccharide repeat unit transporter n=1 Tax=Methanocella arvoryzae (strain DSM 22066 / NBRC 105507 / MRE50) TaxID=351160 RepID=Q0W4F5_METAR|nr:oligosaccharide repeat-containing transporter [Methanocella arvoryzae]CAJ36738.1 putative oligosaccharide repeat unit transporter [Methanocella arvoryzae MRE50]
MQVHTSIEKYYKEPLYRNSFLNILNGVVGAVFGLLFWMVATRQMTSGNLGIVNAIISAATLILVVSRLGMDTGIVRFLARSPDKNSLYNGSSFITLSVALGLTAVFIIGLDWFSPTLILLRQSDILFAFFVYILVNSMYYMQSITLLSLRRSDINFAQNLILGIRVPLLFFLYYLFPNTLGILLILDVSYMGAFLFSRIVLSKTGLRFTTKVNWGQIRKSWKYSLGGYTSNLFAIMPTTLLPIIIINTLGPSSNAYFFIAYTIASFIMMIPNSICSALFVEGSHDMPVRDISIKSLKLIFALLIPLSLFMFLFGDMILMLFNKEYSLQSFEILRLLVLSNIFSAVTLFYISIKKIQKDMGIVNLINSSITVMIILLSYFFIGIYGLVGVGYAWLLTNLLAFIFILGIVLKTKAWRNKNLLH